MVSVVDVLVLGFANLVADGISMGFGDFVSSSTEKDTAAIERSVTEWDVTNHSGPQKRDLLHQFQALGMDLDDATTVRAGMHTLIENTRIYIYRACLFTAIVPIVPIIILNGLLKCEHLE